LVAQPDRFSNGLSTSALSATTAEGIPPYWSPAYGTPLLPAHPGEAVRTGQFNRVPVLQGVTRDEGTFFTAAGDYTWLTPEVYPELLEFLLGERAPEFEARYPLASYVSPEHAWAALITDGGFVCPSLDSSSDLAAYVPTYAYEFLDREPPRMFELSPGYPLGAYHAAEIPYFHGLAPLSIELSPAQARLSPARS
jgi:para-nitrobenzyl esterase